MAVWWNPAEIWDSWMQCLKQTLPSILELESDPLATGYSSAMNAQSGQFASLTL